MMDGWKLRRVIKGLFKAFAIGLAASVILALLLFLIGLPIHNMSAKNALVFARGGLFIATALLLFALAGLLMSQSNRFDGLKNSCGCLFGTLDIRVAVTLMAVAFVLVDILIDWFVIH